MLSRSSFASHPCYPILIRRCLSLETAKGTSRPYRGAPRLDSESIPQKVWNKLAAREVGNSDAFKAEGMAQRLAVKRMGTSTPIQEHGDSQTKPLTDKMASAVGQQQTRRNQESRVKLPRTSNPRQNPQGQTQFSTNKAAGSISATVKANARSNTWSPRKFDHGTQGQRGSQSAKSTPSTVQTQSRMTQRSRKLSRSKFSKENEEDHHVDMSRYQVNFPNVTVPEFISPNLSRTEEGSLARLAKALRKPRVLKLGNYTKFTRATLLLRGGKGSGRKQVPYAFYMLHHNGSVVASSKRATMQAVGHMILKHYKTKSRLTSNR